VEIASIDVTIDEAARSAHVKATARISGTTLDGQDKKDERALDLQLTRREGDWKIASLTVWSKDDARP
jgi:ketosteroid isomerase-like protein